MAKELTYSNHIEHYRLDAEVADYFKPNAPEAQSIRRRYQYFGKYLNLREGCKILEVGSGGGEALNILKVAHCHYLPLDISFKNLKIIKEKAHGIVSPLVADGFDIPVKDEIIDSLIMSEVLEHLAEPGRALQEIFRIMKKNSLAVLSVPYKEKISFQLCIHCNQLTPTNAHLHSIDEYKLQDWIEKAGFSVVKVKKVNNKAAALFKIPLLTKMFPFSLYKIIDDFLNIIIPKPSHLIMVIHRPR